MEKISLEAKLRTQTGKEVCKKMRKEGFLPSVVYSEGKEAISLAVNERQMFHILHGDSSSNAIVALQIDNEGKTDEKNVIIKDVQFDPVKDTMLHIDFQEISLTEVITVNIPVVSIGEAAGVKNEGGVLEHITWELHVECLPTQIPESIEVNISDLELGHSIHLEDIQLPEGIKALNPPDTALFSVMHPKAAPAEEEEALEEEEAQQAPEVIKQKPQEEEQD